MPELGVAYEILSPSGVRAVLGPLFVAGDDDDYIGPLDPDEGVTGLCQANERPVSEDLTDQDGGVAGDGYAGRMPFSLKGILWPELDGAFDLATVNGREDKVRAACAARRADGTVTWTPTGGDERMVRFRVAATVTIGTGHPRSFFCPLESADWRAYATTELDLGIAEGATGDTVTNDGNAPTPPRFRIDGPITSPVITNALTGETLTLAGTLASGHHLDLDPADRSILLDGVTDSYGMLDFAASTWWELEPGPAGQTVKLEGSATSGATELTVYWRSAWG